MPDRSADGVATLLPRPTLQLLIPRYAVCFGMAPLAANERPQTVHSRQMHSYNASWAEPSAQRETTMRR